MSKSRTAPYYLTKREIHELHNDALVNAFEIAVTDVVNAQNHRASVPAKMYAQAEWIREELLRRLHVGKEAGVWSV